MTLFKTFIQENKYVIFPPKEFNQDNFSSAKLRYRWAYIIIAWFIISVILGYYGELLVPIVPDQGFYREFVMCAGQVLFQTFIIGHLTKGRLIHYLGTMMTVSLIGSFVLLPPLVFAWLSNWHAPWFYVGYFLIVVVLIILIHKERVKRLDLHWIITLSWIVYRLLLLIVIYSIGEL